MEGETQRFTWRFTADVKILYEPCLDAELR